MAASEAAPVRVITDPSTLEMANSGAIWGSVWIDLEGEPFPEAGWNDMAVPLMAELLKVADSIRSPAFRRHTVRFFDGPMWLELEGVVDGTLTLSADGVGETRRTVRVPAERFTAAVVSAARELLSACETKGWGDEHDVRQIARLLGAL